MIKVKQHSILMPIGILFLSFVLYAWFGTVDSVIPDELYSFSSKHTQKSNNWAKVKKKSEGVYTVHSGRKKPPTMVLEFKEALELNIGLSITSSSTRGDIRYIVESPRLPDDSILVKSDQSIEKTISVQSGDFIKIHIDKYDNTFDDWGEVRLRYQQNNFFSYFIVFTIWALFIYWLWKRKQAPIVYYSIFCFLFLIITEAIQGHTLSRMSLIAYSLITQSVFLNSLNLMGLFKKHWMRVVLLTLAVCALIGFHFLVFFQIIQAGHPLVQSDLFAFFQTNLSESLEYIQMITPWWFYSFMLPIYLLGFITIHYKLTQKIQFSFQLIILYSLTSFALIPELPLYSLFEKGQEQYQANIDKFKRIQEKRLENMTEVIAQKDQKGETYLVIIGESQNKNNMSAYGYFRPTTPLLTQAIQSDSIILHHKAYSNHVHTANVMEKALTSANQYNKKNYYESPSVIDIAKASGFKTYWLSNQSLYGSWDNVISVIGKTADEVVSVNKNLGTTLKTSYYDEELIPHLENILEQETEENRIIFVHLMGNHFTYSNRYPQDQWTQFEGKVPQGIVGTIPSKNKSLSAYDNSILYNDHVSHELFAKLKKLPGVNAMMYFADHADDVFQKKAHDKKNFNFYMTEIPMYFWFSPDYKDRYPDKYRSIKSNSRRVFTNDLFFDTFLDLADVKSPHVDPGYSLASSNYKLNPHKAVVLNKKKKFKDLTHHKYWQEHNFSYLQRHKITDKVYPHRVNSIGKLNEIWQLGFRSFEVDLLYGYDKTSRFIVGHNHGQMGVDLETFLETVDHRQIQKMWFDIKNINGNNYNEVLVELHRLQTKYDLKSKALIESSISSAKFAEYSKSGWKTSYYLPTGKIKKLITGGSHQDKQEYAQQLIQQLTQQEIQAISFDTSLYPFVKLHLEPLIEAGTSQHLKQIDYHVWWGPALKSPQFYRQINVPGVYSDPKVKTILSKFESVFNL